MKLYQLAMLFFGITNWISVIIILLSFRTSILVPIRERKDVEYNSSLPDTEMLVSDTKIFFVIGILFLIMARILYSYVTDFSYYYKKPSETLQMYMVLWFSVCLIAIIVNIIHKIIIKNKRDGRYDASSVIVRSGIYTAVYFVLIFLLL